VGRSVHKGAVTAFFSFILVAFSCVKPSSEELYLSSDRRDPQGGYSFTFPLEDSLSYDVTLYTLMDCSDYRFAKFSGARMLLEWRSPSDSLLKEERWLQKEDVSSRTFYSKHFVVPLSKGVRPYESGDWTLKVTVPPKAVSRYRMSGLGVKVSQSENN